MSTENIKLEDTEMTQLNGQTIINTDVLAVTQHNMQNIQNKGKPITSGKNPTPLKVIIYGEQGMGKSYFASFSKNPIFIDLEGNIGHLDCEKKEVSTLKELYEFINELIDGEYPSYKTFVVDSADGLVDGLIIPLIRKSYSKEELGYGGDIKFAKEEIYRFIAKLEELRKYRNMRIIITAKPQIVKYQNPLVPAYDRWVFRMNEKLSGIFCDWANCILFATKEISTETEDLGFNKKRKTATGSSGYRRIMYTENNGACIAKNVFNLPYKMKLDWNEFESAVKKFFS